MNENCLKTHGLSRMAGHKHRNGPSSYHMQNPDLIFENINLIKGSIFADIGCGAGDYSIHASKIVGSKGKVYSIDQSNSFLNSLLERCTEQSITNIIPVCADIKNGLNICESGIDTCMLSTVLHCCKSIFEWKQLIIDTHTMLKNNGDLAIIECKKEASEFGPPLNMRIGKEELEYFILSFGFKIRKCIDLGYNYMYVFSKI